MSGRVHVTARKHVTPSYGATARRSRDYRDHGPLGIAVPETDERSTKQWRGPVIRLRDLSIAERRALGDSTVDARPHCHDSWLCPNCRGFTSNGAHRVGRCNHCDAPRPPASRDPWKD